MAECLDFTTAPVAMMMLLNAQKEIRRLETDSPGKLQLANWYSRRVPLIDPKSPMAPTVVE